MQMLPLACFGTMAAVRNCAKALKAGRYGLTTRESSSLLPFFSPRALDWPPAPLQALPTPPQTPRAMVHPVLPYKLLTLAGITQPPANLNTQPKAKPCPPPSPPSVVSFLTALILPLQRRANCRQTRKA